jgi:hypothetical protein
LTFSDGHWYEVGKAQLLDAACEPATLRDRQLQPKQGRTRSQPASLILPRASQPVGVGCGAWPGPLSRHRHCRTTARGGLFLRSAHIKHLLRRLGAVRPPRRWLCISLLLRALHWIGLGLALRCRPPGMPDRDTDRAGIHRQIPRGEAWKINELRKRLLRPVSGRKKSRVAKCQPELHDWRQHDSERPRPCENGCS